MRNYADLIPLCNVAMMNISQETDYFHDSVRYPKYKSSTPFLILEYILVF